MSCPIAVHVFPITSRHGQRPPAAARAISRATSNHPRPTLAHGTGRPRKNKHGISTSQLGRAYQHRARIGVMYQGKFCPTGQWSTHSKARRLCEASAPSSPAAQTQLCICPSRPIVYLRTTLPIPCGTRLLLGTQKKNQQVCEIFANCSGTHSPFSQAIRCSGELRSWFRHVGPRSTSLHTYGSPSAESTAFPKPRYQIARTQRRGPPTTLQNPCTFSAWTNSAHSPE